MDDLAHLPKPVLQMALARIRAEHKGAILTGTVLQYADHALGRLLPAEAYALAMNSQDERATVVWNNEIAEAWGLAAPLLAAGDKFGARQAFMEAYARITGEARATRRRPQLQVSLGYDAEGRTRAVQEAIAAGRLPGGWRHCPTMCASSWPCRRHAPRSHCQRPTCRPTARRRRRRWRSCRRCARC